MDTEPRIMKVQSADLQYVVDVITSKIYTYDIQVNPLSLRFFFFLSDNPNLTEAFDDVRKELVDKGFIPFMYRNGENFIDVSRRPPQKYRGVYVNLIMLILTLVSTIYVGSIYASDFVSQGPNANLLKWLYGFVFFSAPLMLILGVHETGHYLVAKRHHVKASLPFFIPFPFGLGTFGAFISLRDPIPNKRAMTEIGIAGPLAGFLTALPLLFVAEYLQGVFEPVAYSMPFSINFPLIYSLLGLSKPVGVPIFPMVFSVWVGMFATAMNLIPVGQLDGGHIVRGLLGKRANLVDYIFLIFLFIIGIRYYQGWLFLALFVVFIGLTHPPALDDYSKLNRLDIVLGVVALVMFIITFTIIPIVVA